MKTAVSYPWEGEVKFREQSKALLVNILYRAVLVSGLPITSKGPTGAAAGEVYGTAGNLDIIWAGIQGTWQIV